MLHLSPDRVVSVLRVVPSRTVPHLGTIVAGVRSFRCALGPAGVVFAKREGDGGTPAGDWPLRRVYWRADRIALPLTALPAARLTETLGWCDDASDARYNRPVALPFRASAERMWREDHLYDVVVVLGHNDSPPVPGRGSCIFFHLARDDYAPTEGCIAVARADMAKILSMCGPNTRMLIAP